MSRNPFSSYLQEGEKLLSQPYKQSQSHYDGVLAGLKGAVVSTYGLAPEQLDEVKAMIRRLEAKIAADTAPTVGGFSASW